MTLPPATERARLGRLTLAIVAAGLLVRVVIAALVPLLPDEAYYWEWSRRLAGGYFDHPPAVAWLIAGGTALLGPTPLGVRLGTLLSGTGTIVLVVAIARRLGGSGAAFRAAVLLLCAPLVTIGLAIATTDAPALCAIAAALLCILIALEHPVRSAASTRWWLMAGIAFGCGLLSKLTSGIVGASVAVALLARPSLRRQLAAPGPWLAVLCAALVATPVIWWNAHHDWISLRFQLTHGLGAPKRGSVLGRELSLFGAQLGLVSPGIFLLALGATWRALRESRPDDGEPATTTRAVDGPFLLAVVGALVLAFFAYSAIRRPVEANWPAPALVALIPLVAISSGLTIRRWWPAAAAAGGVLVAAALLQLAIPVLPLPAPRDPVARAFGWRSLAAAADSTRDALGGTGDAVWLAADRYPDAAEMAFLGRGQPTVFALNLGGRRNQYDLWPPLERSARVGDALVVALDTGSGGADVARALQPHFAAVAPGRIVALTRAGDTVTMRRIWSFSGWRGTWPARSPAGR